MIEFGRRQPSFGTAVGLAPTRGPGLNKIYHPRRAKQLLLGLLGIVLGSVGLLPLRQVFLWAFSGGPEPDSRSLIYLLALIFLPAGVFIIINTLRGLPRLTVTPARIELESGLGTRWAAWDSLDPFEVWATRTGRRDVLSANARVIGPNVSSPRLKSFSLPDQFVEPISAIVAQLNGARAGAVGTSGSLLSPAAAAEEIVGLAGFTLPWLTLALLAVLIVGFVIENLFPVTPGTNLTPSVPTLVAMGGLSRPTVLGQGEWYRLFTAPLLHGGFVHILSNGVALLLGGALLERLVGRAWFLAFFVVGALGGSLMSLAVTPANVVSIGASGALMGMFAALYVGSFRLAAGTQARHKLQLNSLQVLIPSLLPLFSVSSLGRIDYGAHFGGAIAGAAMAALLLKFWPSTERLPGLRPVAAVISVIGMIAFGTSIGFAVMNYPKYNVALIPSADVPKNFAEITAHADDLARRYPNDPRSHLYVGQTLLSKKDAADAEPELRAALTGVQQHSLMFTPQLEIFIRGVLVADLAAQGKLDDAKTIAHPLCSAPPGSINDNMSKFLAAQHLCN